MSSPSGDNGPNQPANNTPGQTGQTVNSYIPRTPGRLQSSIFRYNYAGLSRASDAEKESDNAAGQPKAPSALPLRFATPSAGRTTAPAAPTPADRVVIDLTLSSGDEAGPARPAPAQPLGKSNVGEKRKKKHRDRRDDETGHEHHHHHQDHTRGEDAGTPRNDHSHRKRTKKHRDQPQDSQPSEPSPPAPEHGSPSGSLAAEGEPHPVRYAAVHESNRIKWGPPRVRLRCANNPNKWWDEAFEEYREKRERTLKEARRQFKEDQEKKLLQNAIGRPMAPSPPAVLACRERDAAAARSMLSLHSRVRDTEGEEDDGEDNIRSHHRARSPVVPEVVYKTRLPTAPSNTVPAAPSALPKVRQDDNAQDDEELIRRFQAKQPEKRRSQIVSGLPDGVKGGNNNNKSWVGKKAEPALLGKTKGQSGLDQSSPSPTLRRSHEQQASAGWVSSNGGDTIDNGAENIDININTNRNINSNTNSTTPAAPTTGNRKTSKAPAAPNIFLPKPKPKSRAAARPNQPAPAAPAPIPAAVPAPASINTNNQQQLTLPTPPAPTTRAQAQSAPQQQLVAPPQQPAPEPSPEPSPEPISILEALGPDRTVTKYIVYRTPPFIPPTPAEVRDLRAKAARAAQYEAHYNPSRNTAADNDDDDEDRYGYPRATYTSRAVRCTEHLSLLEANAAAAARLDRPKTGVVGKMWRLVASGVFKPAPRAVTAATETEDKGGEEETEQKATCPLLGRGRIEFTTGKVQHIWVAEETWDFEANSANIAALARSSSTTTPGNARRGQQTHVGRGFGSAWLDKKLVGVYTRQRFDVWSSVVCFTGGVWASGREMRGGSGQWLVVDCGGDQEDDKAKGCETKVDEREVQEDGEKEDQGGDEMEDEEGDDEMEEGEDDQEKDEVDEEEDQEEDQTMDDEEDETMEEEEDADDDMTDNDEYETAGEEEDDLTGTNEEQNDKHGKNVETQPETSKPQVPKNAITQTGRKNGIHFDSDDDSTSSSSDDSSDDEIDQPIKLATPPLPAKTPLDHLKIDNTHHGSFTTLPLANRAALSVFLDLTRPKNSALEDNHYYIHFVEPGMRDSFEDARMGVEGCAELARMEWDPPMDRKHRWPFSRVIVEVVRSDLEGPVDVGDMVVEGPVGGQEGEERENKMGKRKKKEERKEEEKNDEVVEEEEEEEGEVSEEE